MTCRLPLDPLLGHVGEVRADTPGSVTVTVSPGPITGVLAAAEAERVQAARAAAAPRRRPRAAARCTSSTSADSASRRAVAASSPAGLRRPHAARQHLLGCAHAGGDRRACATAQRTPPRPAGRPAPARPSRWRSLRLRARAGALALGGRRGVAGVEVLGQQRSQQRRHRNQRRPRPRCGAAPGIGVVAAQQPVRSADVVGRAAPIVCRRPGGSVVTA